MARLVTSGIGTLTPLVVALLRANLDLLVEPKVPELSTGFVGSWTFMRINGAIRLGIRELYQRGLPGQSSIWRGSLQP